MQEALSSRDQKEGTGEWEGHGSRRVCEETVPSGFQNGLLGGKAKVLAWKMMSKAGMHGQKSEQVEHGTDGNQRRASGEAVAVAQAGRGLG